MDEQKHNEEIRKGFNAGYLLEKLNPELAQKLRNGIADKKNPFLFGMLKGAEQYNQESFFDSPPPNMPDNIQNLDMNSPESNKDQEKDMGFEP